MHATYRHEAVTPALPLRWPCCAPNHFTLENSDLVITIGEPAGGEEACDTSSSSDGEGSSDGDYDSADNAFDKPLEQVS